jgi:alpha-tubulin suppressor-like RCC1 family protein
VQVIGLGAGSGIRGVLAGGSHSLAIADHAVFWAWGNNSSGQLGDGTAPTDHDTPVRVRFETGASS